MTDIENNSNVCTGAVIITVQGIEEDAVFPPVAVLDEDSFLVLSQLKTRSAAFPEALRLSVIVLLDNTSSFFCSIVRTFVSLAIPIM